MKPKTKPTKPRVIAAYTADDNHQVVSLLGGRGDLYRKEPCSGCPWRVDQTGSFPAKAFEHSARTAYDMAETTFACHESGKEKPATCAGFLLRGADHNLIVRLKMSNGQRYDDVTDGGHQLFDNYRAMAIANGVDPASESLKPCRD